MPILKENQKRYPRDWKLIALRIKERAGWRCECTGECGRAPEHAHGRCPNVHEGVALGFGFKVVLTTAHLDHTPENCDDQNLRAMCQCCHLAYDREHHAETAARRRREAKNTTELFPTPQEGTAP